MYDRTQARQIASLGSADDVHIVCPHQENNRRVARAVLDIGISIARLTFLLLLELQTSSEVGTNYKLQGNSQDLIGLLKLTR